MQRPRIPHLMDCIILATGSIILYYILEALLASNFVSINSLNQLSADGQSTFHIYIYDLIRKYLIALRELLPLFISICVCVGSLFFLWYRRLDYVRGKIAIENKFAILKINLPSSNKEVHELMENIFESLHQGGAGPWWGRIKGKTSRIYSFEMAVTNGKLTFYIRCMRGDVTTLTNIIQGQYKGAKLIEVEDYVKPYPLNHKEYTSTVFEYKLSKNSIFPINTYIDLGLEDKGLKEEEKSRLGPLSGFFETVSTVSKDEYYWLQIITRVPPVSTRKSWSILSGDFWRQETFKDNTEDEINKIKLSTLKKKPLTENPTTEPESFRKEMLSPNQQDLIERMGRKLSKSIYEVGIRSIYIRKKTLASPMLTGALGRIFRRVGSGDSNKISVNRGHSDDLWFFNDTAWTKNAITKQAFHHYRMRSWFYYPMHFSGITFITPFFWFGSKRQRMFLSTEELATIFYFPRIVGHIQTLEHTETRRSEAPLNLPE